ncbi:MAG: DUF4384 domain-containing protein [Thermoanaerobaculia bacterium]
MRTGLLTASGLLLAAMAAALPAQTSSPRAYTPRESDNAPQIDLWLDQVSYNVGDRIAPHFQSESGAYVTIVRVTSDGEVRVLYPQRPRDQRSYERAQLVNDRVPYSSIDRRFEVYESEGMGFVFAIASYSKFDYSYFAAGSDWSINRLASIRYGDPFEIVRRFADRTLGDKSDFSMDYVSYQVYNDAAPSRYATRYDYNTYDDYYDSCLSAFGYGYSLYCQPFYQDYPIIITSRTPRSHSPTGRHYAGKHVHPRIGDPILHGAPSEAQPVAEGRFPNHGSSDDAAAARRERLLKSAAPRDRGAPGADTRPLDAAPRIYTSPTRTIPDRPRNEPQRAAPPQRQDVPRSEPQRIEIPQRMQPAAPRVEVVRPAPPPPRVEVRNEPARVEVVRPAPAPSPPAPAKKN